MGSDYIRSYKSAWVDLVILKSRGGSELSIIVSIREAIDSNKSTLRLDPRKIRFHWMLKTIVCKFDGISYFQYYI